MLNATWLDRAIGYFAPGYAFKRARARAAADVLARHYEAASAGRRTIGWNRPTGDANAMVGPAASRLRASARDLVRNNGNAEAALRTIAKHVAGSMGIVGKPAKANKRLGDTWKAWADSTDCDSDGRNNFAGLQRLVMRTVVESGECLIRRRLRRPDDGLAIPLQLQVLEPDYLDSLRFGSIEVKNSAGVRVGTNQIIQGVEFDFLGRRVGYWLFRQHPGAALAMADATSYRVPAESVLHVYRQDRPGQVRGASWFAPVLLKFKDFDDFDDATLMKQKIAACLAVITTDIDGSGAALGLANAEQTPEWDSLEPGMIVNTPAGRQVTVVQPPTVREYPDYTAVTLRQIATGMGVSYEELTGDYSQVNYSSARMSRISHWDNVNEWRWLMLAPQFLDPAWSWAMQALEVMGIRGATQAKAYWTAPPPPLVDPDKEGLAYKRLIRSGLMSLSEALRERGYDPEAVLVEIAADNDRLDELELILDSDPRNTTEQGIPRQAGLVSGANVSTFEEPPPPPEPPPPAEPEAPVDDDDEDEEAEEAKAKDAAA